MRETKNKSKLIKKLARVPFISRPIHEGAILLDTFWNCSSMKKFGPIRKEYFKIRDEIASGKKTISQVYTNDSEIDRDSYEFDPTGSFNHHEILGVYAKTVGKENEFIETRKAENLRLGRKFMDVVASTLGAQYAKPFYIESDNEVNPKELSS